MEFAEDKCLVLTITRNNPRNIVKFDYHIHNYNLKKVNSAKYLGVILDSKLTFREHIDTICKRAHSTRQFLQRTLSRCDKPTKALACTTFVRPIVEYAATVWDPHRGNQTLVKKLESVQNKAVRFTHSTWQRQTSVSAMRCDPGWDTLQERRAWARLIMLRKISLFLVAILHSVFP